MRNWNPRPPDFKSGALTTRPHCLPYGAYRNNFDEDDRDDDEDNDNANNNDDKDDDNNTK